MPTSPQRAGRRARRGGREPGLDDFIAARGNISPASVIVFIRSIPARPASGAGGCARARRAVAGRFADIGRGVEAEMERRKGRRIPMNIDGATAVIYSRARLSRPRLAAASSFCRARSVSWRTPGSRSQQGGRIKGPMPPGIPYTTPASLRATSRGVGEARAARNYLPVRPDWLARGARSPCARVADHRRPPSPVGPAGLALPVRGVPRRHPGKRPRVMARSTCRPRRCTAPTGPQRSGRSERRVRQRRRRDERRAGSLVRRVCAGIIGHVDLRPGAAVDGCWRTISTRRWRPLPGSSPPDHLGRRRQA